MKCRLTAWARCSTFFEKALVSRMNRRIPHPHREVLPLDVGGGDVFGVRVAVDGVDLDPQALGRAVPPGRSCAVGGFP
jgi:hypothetical protein